MPRSQDCGLHSSIAPFSIDRYLTRDSYPCACVQQNQAPTQETISFFAPGASYSSLGLADEVEEFAEDGSRISVAFDMPPQSFLLFATPVVVDISVYNTFILRISLGNPDDLPFLFGVFQLDADQDGAPEDTSNILNLPAFVTDTTDNVMTIEIPMEGAIQSSANILFFANAQVNIHRQTSMHV